jgi:hypothetical protein
MLSPTQNKMFKSHTTTNLSITDEDENDNTFSFDKSTPHSDLKLQFLKYVYGSHCVCNESCITIEGIVTQVKKSDKCNQVLATDSQDYTMSMNNVIDLFVTLEIIYLVKSRYFLKIDGKFRAFTWDNVKQVKDNETRMLLWMFRKCIVDSILKGVLQNLINEIRVYSVGSTKLDSDYDLTLYGSPKYVERMTALFNKRFTNLLYDTSSSVFDTNVYATGFISYIKDDTNVKFTCGKETFIYIPQDSSYSISQFIWALMHYHKILTLTFDKDISSRIFEELSYIKYSLVAKEIYDYLKIQNIDYYYILKNPNLLLDTGNYNSTPLLHKTDYISLSNVYADEAYYTRGAFMHVVVNTQMCKGDEKIKLDEHDLIHSIIENSAFYIHAHKQKYINRIISAIGELSVIDSNYKGIQLTIEDIDDKDMKIDTVLINYTRQNIAVINFINDCLRIYSSKLESDVTVPMQKLSVSGKFLGF